jgi:hypothetical protein
MIEANVLQSAVRLLEARLPPGWELRSTSAGARVASRREAFLEIVAPDGAKARVLVRAMKALAPRAVDALPVRTGPPALEPLLVVAPFLSPRTRARLRDAGLSFLDLTGNTCLTLSQPGLYVETEGASRDPTPIGEPGRTLRGAKAGRVVRVLCDLGLPLSISALATHAAVDVSYASRIVAWLARESLLERRRRGGVESVDKPGLLRRWATDYEVLTSNDARTYLDPRGLDHLVRQVQKGTGERRYAITGSLAANRVAPLAPARLAMVYVDDVESAAEAWQLRPTDTGTNVILLAPFDDVVFERTQTVGGLTLVAASQMAVDLLTSPGRAPSEAEAVLGLLAS